MIRTMKHKLENDLKNSNALMENVLQQRLGSLQRKKEMNMSDTELSTSEVDGFAAAIENELKKVTQQIESDTNQFLVESDGGRLSIDSAASERRQFSTPQNDDIDNQQEPEDRFREQQLEYDSKILELVSSVNKQNHTPKSLSKENEEIEQDIDMCKLKVAKEILEKDLEHEKLVIERQSTFIEAFVQNSHLSVDMYHGCTPEELLDNLRVDLCQLNGSYPNGAISNLVNDSDKHLPRISSLDPYVYDTGSFRLKLNIPDELTNTYSLENPSHQLSLPITYNSSSKDFADAIENIRGIENVHVLRHSSIESGDTTNASFVRQKLMWRVQFYIDLKVSGGIASTSTGKADSDWNLSPNSKKSFFSERR